MLKMAFFSSKLWIKVNNNNNNNIFTNEGRTHYDIIQWNKTKYISYLQCGLQQI